MHPTKVGVPKSREIHTSQSDDALVALHALDALFPLQALYGLDVSMPGTPVNAYSG